MSKIRRRISIVLVLTLMIGLMEPAMQKALAASARISAENVSGKAGDEIVIPVYISENPGIMGFVINVTYDTEVLNVVSVTKSSLLSGQFDDNHETPGNIKILWAGTDNMSQNGELFTLRFKILDNVKVKETKLEFSYSKSDTFDADLNDVEFSCSSAIIAIGGAEFSPEPLTEPSSIPVATPSQDITVPATEGNYISGMDKTVKQGESFEIPVSIKDNKGLLGFVFEITFDANRIKINSVVSGAVIPSGSQFDYSIDAVKPGKLRILWAGTDVLKTDGVLFKLNCTALEKAALGNSIISLGYSKSDTFDSNYKDVMLNCGDVSVNITGGGVEKPAESENKSDGFQYKVNEDGISVTITKCNLTDYEITIPSKIENYTVTHIGDAAFKGLTSMGKVNFPDTVITFRESCFEDCTKLISMSVPASIQIIEKNAFKNSGIFMIYYAGNEADWKKISIASAGNEKLKNTTVISKDFGVFYAIEQTTTTNPTTTNPTNDSTTETLKSRSLDLRVDQTLYVGDTGYFNATYLGLGTEKTWKSSDTSVGTISQSGRFKAKKAGTTYITFSVGSYRGYEAASRTAKVTVKKYKGIIEVSGKITVKRGKSASLDTFKVGNGKLTYKSSKKSIVTVSKKGKIKGKKKGTATITIKLKATKKYTGATKKVKVVVK